MNVCLLINSFNLGGAEKLIYDVAYQFKKNNECNCIVVAMKEAETTLEKQIMQNLKNDGICIDSVKKPVGGKKIYAIKKIRQILKKYDIDVLHTNGQSPDFYGRLAAFTCKKVKTVITIHSTDGYSNKIEHFFRNITGAYTAVSKEAAVYGREKLGIKNISVVNNGIDFERYIGKEIENKRIILSVGRVVPQKGYINVATEVSNFLKKNLEYFWYIVGETNQDLSYFEKLQYLIDDEVKSRVVFTGAVTDPENYYKNAECFLLPSEFEGFGIAFIEAMAAKLPVICNRVGVILDIENAGGKIAFLNKNEFNEAMESAKTITADELDFNYEFCYNNFSIESITKKYIDVYNSVLAK